jgi:hypothetical protein
MVTPHYKPSTENKMLKVLEGVTAKVSAKPKVSINI